MSIARLSENSDVYVYRPDERTYICHFCTFNASREVFLRGRVSARRHMRKHLTAGDRVPEKAFGYLEKGGDL